MTPQGFFIAKLGLFMILPLLLAGVLYVTVHAKAQAPLVAEYRVIGPASDGSMPEIVARAARLKQAILGLAAGQAQRVEFFARPEAAASGGFPELIVRLPVRLLPEIEALPDFGEARPLTEAEQKLQLVPEP